MNPFDDDIDPAQFEQFTKKQEKDEALEIQIKKNEVELKAQGVNLEDDSYDLLDKQFERNIRQQEIELTFKDILGPAVKPIDEVILDQQNIMSQAAFGEID